MNGGRRPWPPALAYVGQRRTAGVTLTSLGRNLVPYADAVARLIVDARKAVQENGTPHGELRSGAMETTAALRLPPILKTYAAMFPLVDVQIETGPTLWLIDRVLDRQLDGAFVCGPVKHVDLAAKPVVTEELVLVTPTAIATLNDLNFQLRRDGSENHCVSRRM